MKSSKKRDVKELVILSSEQYNVGKDMFFQFDDIKDIFVDIKKNNKPILNKIAKKLGIKNISKMKKKELVDEIKKHIKFVDEKEKKKKEIVIEEDVIEDESKDEKVRPKCGTRKSKKNPDAYSKDELVEKAISMGISKTVAKKMTINQLCKKLFGVKEDDEKSPVEGDFDYTKCSSYNIKQLQKFAKLYDVILKGTKKHLCEQLVKKEIKRLWDSCMDMNEEDIKYFAKSKGLSTKGTKKELCNRIFKEEVEKAGGVEGIGDNDSDDYDLFFHDYFNEKDKTKRNKIFKKYESILPIMFVLKFKKLSDKDKMVFVEEYLKPENIDESPVVFIDKLFKDDEEEKDDIIEDEEEDELPCIKNSKLKLQEHQKKVVHHMLKNRGLLAIHSVGSGKTLTAVTSIQCVMKSKPGIKVVIITPTSLQDNMKKEFIAYGADPNHPDITFSTIDKFSRDYNKNLYNCKNTFLIIDEAHNLKTHITSVAGKRSKSVINCAKKTFKVLLLTATPILNRPNEIVNLIAMIDGDDPISPSMFDRVIMMDDTEFERYFKCKISLFKRDVSEFYPSFEEHEIEFVMSSDYYKKYRDIEKQQENSFCSSLFGKDCNLQAFFNGVRRAANNLELEHGPKINWIIDKIINENKKNKRNKTLIYSSFLDAGSKLVMKRLDALNIPYVKVDGTMSKLKRKDAVEKYNTGKVSIIIISKAGGEGLDLKETRHVIITEPTWNDANLEQVKGRAIRFKSHVHLPEDEQHVDIWNLFMIKPPEDEREEDDDYMDGIDIIISDKAKEKKVVIDEFINRLESLSIENNSCN